VPATLDAGVDQMICSGESANLSAQLDFSDYQWTNLNTGAAFAGKDIVVSPPVTTTYALQALDANGCTVTDTLEVLLNTTILASINNENPILCPVGPNDLVLVALPEAVTITTQEYAGEQVEFIWTHNNDTIDNISHQLLINPVSSIDGGQYAVTVIVNECAAFSDTLEVEIYEPLNSNIATVASQTCVTGSEDLNLVALPSNGAVPFTYQWTGPNGFSSTDSLATLVNITSANR